MSLVWTESFVGWTSIPNGLYTGGGCTPNVGYGPNGQNCMTGSQDSLQKLITSSPATIGVGVRFRQQMVDTNQGMFLLLNDAGVGTQLYLWHIYATENIQVRRGDNTVLGTSAPGTCLHAVWYYLTIDATIHPTAGSVLVTLDGVTILNLTGVNTRNTATSRVNEVNLTSGNNSGFQFCDWYITDNVVSGAEPVATIGDVRIIALRPSGAGSNAAFTPSAGANWQNVDDAPGPDGDATYNASSNPTDADSFVTPGVGTTVVANAIPAVFLKTYARKDDAGVRSLTRIVKLGANVATGVTAPLSAGYDWQADKFALDPAGNPWTKANVNAAEFGYDLIA